MRRQRPRDRGGRRSWSGSPWRRVALWAALFLIPLGAGCFKEKWKLTVYPDGSGSLEFSYAFGKEGEEMLKDLKGDASPLLSSPEAPITRQADGILAYSATRHDKEGGFSYHTTKAYFEDINAVRLWSEVHEGLEVSFSLQERDDGTMELTFKDTFITSNMKERKTPVLPGELGEEQLKLWRSMMEPMLEGLEANYRLVVPGEILEAEGMETEGRESVYSFGVDEYLDLILHPKKAEGGLSGKVVYRPQGDYAEAMAALKVEMAEAKVAWEKAKAAWKKEQAEKEPAPEEPEEGGQGPD